MEKNNKPKKVDNIVRKSNDIFVATKSSLDSLKENYKEFSTLLNAFNDGNVKVELRKRYLQKMIDETWVQIVEDTLPCIDAIIRKPGGGLEDFEEIRPIELTRKVTSKSVVHLTQHTDFINEIKEDGSVMPAKLLNVYNDETIFTYENRFINTLILRLFSFVMLRYENAKEYGEDEMNTQYTYASNFEDGDCKGKINISIEVAEPPKDAKSIKNYLYTTDLWRRVEKVVAWCKSLISSQFVKDMQKTYIHPPVMRTNKLLKNVNFRQCLSLWEFLESYQNSGYETKVHESLEEVDDKFLDDFYNSVIAQYVLFQNSIDNKVYKDKTLDARDIKKVDAKIVDELKQFNQDEYNFEEDLSNPIDTFENETEETIDLAVRVAIEADKKMFTQDDYFIEPQRRIIYKYKYSYLARLILAQDPTQTYYTEVKNLFLSYKKVKTAISWKHELVKLGREKVAMLECKGKQLVVHLPLNPDDYTDTKYKVVDMREKKTGTDFPMAYKIHSTRSMNYALELINESMKKFDTEFDSEHIFVDYHMPYKTAEQMCKMKPPLVKKIAAREENVIVEHKVVKPRSDRAFQYIYSYLGRMILAQDPTQSFYTEIKNEILSFEGVKSKISWKHELFTCGRIKIAKLKVKGKTLQVYLPLDPKDYENSKVKTYDVSDSKSDEDYPLLIKVKSSRACRYAMELINNIIESNGIIALENPRVIDYHMDYKTPEELCSMNPPLARRANIHAPAVKAVKKKLKIQRAVGKNSVHTVRTEYVEEQPQVITVPGEATVKYVEKAPSLQRYNLSFTARLIRAQYPLQDYYTQIKNELLKYEDVKNRVSWRHEIFWSGSHKIAKILVKGKTLNVYLPLNPEDYIDSRYKFVDVSNQKANEDTPFLMKISSPRKASHIIYLINEIAEELELQEKFNPKFVDYHRAFKTIEQMLAMKPVIAKLKSSEEEKKEESAKKTIKKSSSNKYQNSLVLKFMKANRPIQNYYSEIRNYLSSYKQLICGNVWTHDEYAYKDSTLFEVEVAKSTLSFIINEPVTSFNPKYHVKAMMDENNEPMEFKSVLYIRSERALNYAKEIISNKTNELGLQQGEIPTVNYRKEYKADKSLSMLKKPLIKVVHKKGK